MNLIQTLGMASGVSMASGVNSYASIAILGLMGKFGGYQLPGQLQLATNEWVIAAAIIMYGIEFVSDKIPLFDSLWGITHTAIRPVLGAIVAMASTSEYGEATQAVATLLGGGLALTSHATKEGSRLIINLSPEPFTNSIASILEDVFVFCMIILSILLPIIALFFVFVFFALTMIFAPMIYGKAKIGYFKILLLLGFKKKPIPPPLPFKTNQE